MITDIVEDNGGIPVLDHMREPPMLEYNIMRPVTAHDMENCAHFIVGTVSGRTEYEAVCKMETVVRDLGPGSYYIVRKPSIDDMFVKRAI